MNIEEANMFLVGSRRTTSMATPTDSETPTPSHSPLYDAIGEDNNVICYDKWACFSIIANAKAHARNGCREDSKNCEEFQEQVLQWICSRLFKKEFFWLINNQHSVEASKKIQLMIEWDDSNHQKKLKVWKALVVWSDNESRLSDTIMASWKVWEFYGRLPSINIMRWIRLPSGRWLWFGSTDTISSCNYVLWCFSKNNIYKSYMRSLFICRISNTTW